MGNVPKELASVFSKYVLLIFSCGLLWRLTILHPHDVVGFASFGLYSLTRTLAAKRGSQLLRKPGAANLTQQGLDHIIARHWFSSGAKGAGKFIEGTTGSGLKSMINTTTTQGCFPS